MVWICSHDLNRSSVSINTNMSSIADLIERTKALPEPELRMHIRMRSELAQIYATPPRNNVHASVAIALMLELDRRHSTPPPLLCYAKSKK